MGVFQDRGRVVLLHNGQFLDKERLAEGSPPFVLFNVVLVLGQDSVVL